MGIKTNVALEEITVSGSSTSTVSFTNISQSYTDLYIIMNLKMGTSNQYPRIRFNSDTGTSYSDSTLYGTGTATTGRDSNVSGSGYIMAGAYVGTSEFDWNCKLDIFSYSSTSFYKTFLVRANRSSLSVDSVSGRWSSTSAITRIDLIANGGVFSEGCTFSLFGVASAPTTAAKATGGTVYQNDSYVWHVFTSSGTFTPSQSLTNVDYLVIAGGGGGRTAIGGGAGAGGYRTTVGTSGGGASAENKISLSSGVGYTVTIGGGGGGGNGSGSSFSGSGITTISCSGGGTGGTRSSATGSGGGSGGGGGGPELSSGTHSPGSGTANEGFAGASGLSGSSSPLGWHTGGGGGGAGEVAPAVTSMVNKGGDGLKSPIDDVWRGGGGGGGQQYGQPTEIPYLYGTPGRGGGGQGGGYYVAPTNGVAYTGGGGGGGGYAGAGEANSNGGSGIVIIRYPKA